MTADAKDTRTRLEKILDGLTDDLDRIHDDLGWTHSLGWDAPAQIKTQNQRGASLARPDSDDDHVPGAKHDTGLGDDRARHALRTAAPKLIDVARTLALAVQKFAPDAELAIPAKPTELAAMQAAARLCRHRAATLRKLITNLEPKNYPGGLDRPILDAHAHARSALGLLAAALNKADAGHVEPDAELCRICRIRPVTPKKAGRCSTCHEWFHRHGKRERPTALDQADVDVARQAQARRAARGEGYGAA